MMLESFSGRSTLFRNFIAMGFLQAGNFIVPIVTLPYLSRVLGLHSFGIYSFSLAVMVATGVFVEWGFPLCAVGNVAACRDNPNRLSELVSSTVGAKILLAVIGAVAIASASFVFEPFRSARPVLICSYGLVLAYVFNMGWYLQGMERMSLFAIGSLCARLTTIPAILIFVHSRDQAWLAALIQSGASIIAASVAATIVLRSGTLTIKLPDFRQIKTRLSEARHFFLAAAAINLYTASTLIIVGIVREPSTVAIYAGADRIKSAAQNIIAPLSQVFYPRTVYLFRTDPDRATELIASLMWLFGCIGCAATIVLAFFSKQIVILLLGGGFEDSVQVLRILAPIPMISAMSNVLSVQAMVPLGQAGIRSKILILITAFSLPATFILSKYFGAYGAAGVVLFCELAGLISFYLFVRQRFRVLRPLRSIRFW